MKISKKISALILAAFICSSVSVSAYAVDESSESSVAQISQEQSVSESTEKSSAYSESTEVSNDSENSETSEENGESSAVSYSFSEATKGNANLVASEEVLTDDGQFQFIAVTTRDGDVFYVIVDRSKVEDNVYFLNEIDTYDLKALLNKKEDGTAAQVGTVNTANDTSDDTVEESEEESDESEETSDSGFEGSLYILIGIAVLAAIGFVIFKIKKDGGLGKKKSSVELVDDDFDDDDEINEDKE